MRKVFWFCAAGAIVAAGSVYLAAKHVNQDPFGPMRTLANVVSGGVVSGACPASPAANPEQEVPSEPTPAEMQPVGGVIDPMAGPVVATAEKLSGEIAVGEDYTFVPPAQMSTVEISAPAQNALEAPRPCPAVMPYCPEDADSARCRMPYADEDEAESAKTDEKGCAKPAESFFDFWVDFFGRSVSEALPMPGDGENSEPAVSDPPQNEGDENHNYHHTPCCPYTGRCYPEMTPQPALPSTEELEKKVDEEKKNEGDEVCPKKCPVPEKKTDGAQEQAVPPPNCDLDTMEFRTSDLAGWETFLPGAL